MALPDFGLHVVPPTDPMTGPLYLASLLLPSPKLRSPYPAMCEGVCVCSGVVPH